MDSWRAAKEALLFGDELDVLDCEGRSAGQELFIEQLGDKARFTMDKCPGEDLLSLVLGFFTEEDQKLTVEEDLLPARLAAGVQQRRSCAQSTDVALSNILREWLGVQMQPRVINVVASPVIRRSAEAPVLEESRKRSSQSAFIDDDEGDRHSLQESRRRLFPQTFSLGPDYENVQWYQETANLVAAAEERSRGTIGVRDRIRSRKCPPARRIVDERFLQRVVYSHWRV